MKERKQEVIECEEEEGGEATNEAASHQEVLLLADRQRH